MSNNAFGQAVALDFAPWDGLCEWCGQPAVQQITAIGGKYHNGRGFFCRACGAEFIRAVGGPSGDAPVSGQGKTRSKPAEENYGSNHFPCGSAYGEWAERSGEDIPIPLD